MSVGLEQCFLFDAVEGFLSHHRSQRPHSGNAAGNTLCERSGAIPARRFPVQTLAGWATA